MRASPRNGSCGLQADLLPHYAVLPALLQSTSVPFKSGMGTAGSRSPASASYRSRAFPGPGSPGFPQSWSSRYPPGDRRGQKYRRPSKVAPSKSTSSDTRQNISSRPFRDSGKKPGLTMAFSGKGRASSTCRTEVFSWAACMASRHRRQGQSLQSCQTGTVSFPAAGG